MPRRTPREGGPENPEDREQTNAIGVGGVLGPRAEEIAAAAQTIGGNCSATLVRLGESGRFGVSRPRAKPDKFGAEHDVYLSSDGSRVLKFAKNHGFGPDLKDGRLVMKWCDPGEYLARHALLETIFPTEVRVEGLTEEGCFIISQRAIRGGHPTEATVRKFLLGLGFASIPARFGQGGDAWFHRGLEILVMDTAPDNFIAAKQGVVPIDLQIAELSGEFRRFADEVAEFMRLAPRPGSREGI